MGTNMDLSDGEMMDIDMDMDLSMSLLSVSPPSPFKKVGFVDSAIKTKARKITVEKMYSIYEKIAASKDKTSLEQEYGQLVSAGNTGSDKEKQLSIQFMTRFLEHFPKLEDKAIDAMLDMCEDDEVSIRKQAEKDLITVCRKAPHAIPKIADVYAQLLQTNESSELTVLQNCLISLLHINANDTITGFYAQIKSANYLVREKCFKFLTNKLKKLGPDILNLEFETQMIIKTRLILSSLNPDELKTALDLLSDTKMLKMIKGQKELVDMIAHLFSGIKIRPIQRMDGDLTKIGKMLVGGNFVLPFLNSDVCSAQLVVHLCTQVIPKLGDLFALNEEVYFAVLRMLADLAYYSGQIDAIQGQVCFDILLDEVKKFMPLPPADDCDDNTPSINFSFIECLLFVIHKLYGEGSTEIMKPKVLSDFRARLQYLARASQAYMKKLREDLQTKTGDELKTPENRVKITALKTLANITSVIRDMFHHPPSCVTHIGLSWRPLNRLGAKRKREEKEELLTVHMRSDYSSPTPRTARRSNEVYRPPSGRYSSSSSSGRFVTAERKSSSRRDRNQRSKQRRRSKWPGVELVLRDPYPSYYHN